MTEYVIVGDTEKYDGCLVSTAGTSLEKAKAVLNRMLNNPDDNDRKLMRGHTNLRIKATKRENNWWNDTFLAN